MKDKLKLFLFGLTGFVIFCLFTYGCYWVAKNGSYFFFYEDMVQQTIKEMVKPEYLIDAI